MVLKKECEYNDCVDYTRRLTPRTRSRRSNGEKTASDFRKKRVRKSAESLIRREKKEITDV